MFGTELTKNVLGFTHRPAGSRTDLQMQPFTAGAIG